MRLRQCELLEKDILGAKVRHSSSQRTVTVRFRKSWIIYFIPQLLKDSMNGLRAFALRNNALVDYYQLSASGGWQEKWDLLVRRRSVHPFNSCKEFNALIPTVGKSV